MPIGYVVGKRYVIDTKYDRYGDLDVFKRLGRECGKLGYGLHIYYSAMTHGYCCEIRKFESKFRSQTSEHIYYFTEGHKYGPNPLEAACRAIHQSVPLNLILRVLLLEAEAVQLGMEVKDRRALENRLEQALYTLEGIIRSHALEGIIADLDHVPQSITVQLDYINPDHLGAAFLGIPYPKPDVDDDL